MQSHSFPRITDTADAPQPPRISNTSEWPGVIHTRFADVEAAMGREPPWSIYVTRDEVTLAQLINSPAGEGNHHHTHSGHDEWWIIMSGTTEFHLTGGKTFRAETGDICWVPRGTAHHVIAANGRPSARLAVQMVGGSVYELPECEVCGRKWDSVRERDVDNPAVEIATLVRGPVPPMKDHSGYPGVLHTRPADLLKTQGEPPWALTLVSDERNQCNLIADVPGGSNRPHWHDNYDEWWYVAQGTLEWHLTGGQAIAATANDIVWVPRGTVHHIRTVGDEPSLRFAVTVPPAEHIWTDSCEVCGYRHEG